MAGQSVTAASLPLRLKTEVRQQQQDGDDPEQQGEPTVEEQGEPVLALAPHDHLARGQE